jgi:hypothetical protein
VRGLSSDDNVCVHHLLGQLEPDRPPAEPLGEADRPVVATVGDERRLAPRAEQRR